MWWGVNFVWRSIGSDAFMCRPPQRGSCERHVSDKEMIFHVIPRGYYDVAIFYWITVVPDGGVRNGGAAFIMLQCTVNNRQL